MTAGYKVHYTAGGSAKVGVALWDGSIPLSVSRNSIVQTAISNCMKPARGLFSENPYGVVINGGDAYFHIFDVNTSYGRLTRFAILHTPYPERVRLDDLYADGVLDSLVKR